MTVVHKSTKIKGVSDNRTARFVASDESVDRYGDIVLAKGWDTSNFKSNPQFLFGHNSDQLPIGRVTSTWVDGKAFMADVEFLPEGLDEFADKCFQMTKEGFLSAVSVGFNPISYERRYNEDGVPVGTLFKEQELLELSLVPIPANANALQVAKSFNYSKHDIARLFVPDSGKRQIDHARLELELLKLRLSN